MATERNKPEMVRVQLDLPVQRIEELEKLIAKTGVTTRKDLFENALTLLEWAVEQREQGRIIASVDEEEDFYRELVMPALASVKHEAKISRANKTKKAEKAFT
jgi:hypothetical protein